MKLVGRTIPGAALLSIALELHAERSKKCLDAQATLASGRSQSGCRGECSEGLPQRRRIPPTAFRQRQSSVASAATTPGAACKALLAPVSHFKASSAPISIPFSIFTRILAIANGPFLVCGRPSSGRPAWDVRRSSKLMELRQRSRRNAAAAQTAMVPRPGASRKEKADTFARRGISVTVWLPIQLRTKLGYLLQSQALDQPALNHRFGC